jgi:hypothetical protein
MSIPFLNLALKETGIQENLFRSIRGTGGTILDAQIVHFL